MTLASIIWLEIKLKWVIRYFKIIAELHEIFNMLYSTRSKFESDLRNIHKVIIDAMDRQNKKVDV